MDGATLPLEPPRGALPLLGARDLTAPLAWCGGVAMSGTQFVAEVSALAATLPAGGPALNLCQDRWRFAIGLGAALLRGHTSLMPPNAMPETLRRLQHRGMAPYALVDEDAVDAAGLRRVAVRPTTPLAQDRPAAAQGRPAAASAGDSPSTSRTPWLAGQVPAIAATLDAVCLLTSGSTGSPQPHVKPWGPLVANIAAEAERLARLTGRESLHGLTLVATVPPQHSYGFESSVLLAMLGGAAFDSGRPFYPADIVAALARVPRPRALVTTPFHLKTLLASGLPLPAVDLMLSATAPLSPQLAAEAESRLGGALIEIYGCTEAGQVASRRTTAGEVWQALGELRLWREGGERGEGSAGGDDGETEPGGAERFLVQGGHVTQPTPLSDVLELLDERRFRLLGRSGDLIHVAGKRSSLAHLNFQLNRVPGVVDGAFWLPDDVPDGVVRTVAFVVAPGLAAREVVAGLRERLEPAFVPRRVVLLPELPREATGKITVATLRELAARHLSAEGGSAPSLPAAPMQPPAPGDDLRPAAPRAGLVGDVRVTIAADHPAFDGHFPGQPVLPGAVLLSLAMAALEGKPALRARVGAAPVVEVVKFLAPVRPGAGLRIALAEARRGVAFEVFDGGRCVARGHLG